MKKDTVSFLMSLHGLYNSPYGLNDLKQEGRGEMKQDGVNTRETMQWAMSRKNPFFPLLPVLPIVALGMLAVNLFLSYKTYQKLPQT